LVFPYWAIPVSQAIGFHHQEDNRGMFVLPWEGAVLLGTTDMDHDADLSLEPVITEQEISYLMDGLRFHFPSYDVSLSDCISTFSGVRPVLSKGKRAPSAEPREHVVWSDKGLVTITGGKLTTYRRLAADALKAVRIFLTPFQLEGMKEPAFHDPAYNIDENVELSSMDVRRLYGRYGKRAEQIVKGVDPRDLSPIPGTRTLWAELPYVARHERVRHLTDLLLRRVRIGLLIDHGGREHLEKIRKLCERALPWSRERWDQEIECYLNTWNESYALPGQVENAQRAHSPQLAAGLAGELP
jgi:glycerol-3-phosphate dehydrogenase